MSIAIIAILVLFIIFILGTILPINIGVLGFAAAFIVGILIYGLSLDEISSVLPVKLFIFIVGMTYLFAIIQKSGAVDLIAAIGLRLVNGKLGFIPWLLFALSLVLTSVGTFGIAVVSLLAPIAFKIAFKTKTNQLMISIMMMMGMQAGAFSPLNIFGVIVNGGMQTRGFEHSPALLLLNCIIYFGIVSFITFLLFGGVRLFKRRESTSMAYVAASKEMIDEEVWIKQGKIRLDLYKGFCLASIPVIGFLSIGFNMNLGIAAILVGLVLSFISPDKNVGILNVIPWEVILLVTGIFTYFRVMEKIGVMDYVTDFIADMGNPDLAALAVLYVSGFVSAFASTTAYLTSIIPMAETIFMNSHLSSIDLISAISVSSSIVDLSPLSSAGAILLANVQGIKERVFFRQLMMTTGIFIAFGPGLAWLLFIVIGMPW
ncbi:SLC13 family permease [Niallia oryzisoli]|uniref:SLC13 family permease n=1 Tax=Niallia oryzisoli TaxID=1737571 RepID=A0ABZ2CEU9_9BACI